MLAEAMGAFYTLLQFAFPNGPTWIFTYNNRKAALSSRGVTSDSDNKRKQQL